MNSRFGSDSGIPFFDDAPDEMAPLPADTPELKFLRRLGSGGMGVVYAAELRGLGREVAVKMILPAQRASAEARGRFTREARILASLSHPRLIFPYAAHDVGGVPALSMELMTGRTLQDCIDSGVISVVQAVRWTLQILEALDAVHRSGVIHRDVKPSNCYLDDRNEVRLGDFGLSRALSEDLGLTRTGLFLGSPLFAPPEQIRGKNVDQRSDLYAVGATLYALLAGRPPFRSGHFGEAVAAILTEAPPRLSSLRSDLPPGLETCIRKALRKDPRRRYADAPSLLEALTPFARGHEPAKALVRRGTAAAVDGIAISLLTAGLGFLLRLVSDANFGLLGGSKTLLSKGIVFGVRCLYFGLFEGLFAATPGKLLARLRVVRADGGRAPWRAFLRAGIFAAFQSVGGGLLLLGLWMLVRRDRRGPHELGSGTRVVDVAPRPDRAATQFLDPVRRKLPVDAEDPSGVLDRLEPTSIGTVDIVWDPRLARRVWMCHASSRLKTSPRSSRFALRRLPSAPGDVAIEDPGGAALSEYRDRDVALPLSAQHRLANEVIEALADGPLTPGALWIDRTGALRIVPFEVGEWNEGDSEDHPVATLYRCLSGKDRRAAIDLPLSLEAIYDYLEPRPANARGDVTAAVHVVASVPRRVDRARRLAAAALGSVVGAVGFGVSVAAIAIANEGWIDAAPYDALALAGTSMALMAGLFGVIFRATPGYLMTGLRLRCTAAPNRRPYEIAAACVALSAVGVLRPPLALSILGLAVALALLAIPRGTPRGQRASRARAALHGMLVGAPVAACWLIPREWLQAWTSELPWLAGQMDGLTMIVAGSVAPLLSLIDPRSDPIARISGLRVVRK